MKCGGIPSESLSSSCSLSYALSLGSVEKTSPGLPMHSVFPRFGALLAKTRKRSMIWDQNWLIFGKPPNGKQAA